MEFHNWVIQRLLRLLGTPVDGHVIKFNAEADKYESAEEAAVAASPITSEMVAAADEGDVPTIDEEGDLVFQPPALGTVPVTGIDIPAQDDIDIKHKIKGPATGTTAKNHTLKDEDGTLAHEDANEATYRLAADVLNTDDTSTPVNLTGMVFAVTANEIVYVSGMAVMHDVTGTDSACFGFTVPAGCEFVGTVRRIDNFATGALVSAGMGSAINPSSGAETGEQNGGGTYSHQRVEFDLVFKVSSTAGNVQMYFVNRAGDETEPGIREGTFFKVRR